MSFKKAKLEFRKITEYKCQVCNLSEWNNKPLTLEVDHTDGNNQNHELSNLRYLCPNCHSQTETWRGRNIKKSKFVSDNELLHAINTTPNIRQALIKVGMVPKGANYKRVSRLINNKPIDISNSQYNTIWINNGQQNKKIHKKLLDDYLSQKWKKGRIINIQPPSQKGKIWVNNGIVNKMVNPTQIPEGFWEGRFQ